MYVRPVQTHPDRHVVMLTGARQGFAKQIIAQDRIPTDVEHGGVPQLTIADLGMPAYAPPNEGGFYDFGLVHVTGDGGVQFSGEPVLASIAVTAPGALVGGATASLTAAGCAVGGDNSRRSWCRSPTWHRTSGHRPTRG